MNKWIRSIIFALSLVEFFAPSSAAQEFKVYEGDINDAQIDRIDKIDAYLKGFSEKYQKLQEDFTKEKQAHQETKSELQKLQQQIDSTSDQRLKDLESKVSALETKLTGLDVQQMRKEMDTSSAEFVKLKKDYEQAKAMLNQIKLLIQADYASRFTKADSGNNQLKGIVEEINKIQLPIATPTPAATASPAPTLSVTPTSAPANTPSTIQTPVAKPPVPGVDPKKEENFLEKYPIPARQTFCRKPENLKNFQKECLPYL